MLTDRAQGLAREYFAEVVEQFHNVGITAHSTTAAGELVDTVVSRASTGGFDLMALAAGERHPALRHMTESSSEKIRVRSPIPMLILNGHRARKIKGGDIPLTRLLVALNGTRVSEFALPYVRRIARVGKLPITLIRVVPEIAGFNHAAELSSVAPRFVRGAVELAEEYLDGHAALLSQEGFEVTTRVEVGAAAHTLTAVQESAPEHLLVMGSVVRRGWLRSMLGCTADEVIRISGRPLLLIPAGRRPGPSDSGSHEGPSGGSNGPTNS
jgi:nucleotide-binding universal stress UspA family protein